MRLLKLVRACTSIKEYKERDKKEYKNIFSYLKRCLQNFHAEKVYKIKYKINAEETQSLTLCKVDGKVYVGSGLCGMCPYQLENNTKKLFVSCVADHKKYRWK